MERKRKINVEVNEETYVDTDGINRGLKRMAVLSEDSIHLSDILGNVAKNFFLNSPNGKKNYGGESPKLGKISFGLDLEKEHVAVLVYDSVDRRSLTIGEINLEEKTFSTYWNDEHKYDESYWNIPKNLMKETEELMKFLNLKKQKTS